MKERKDRLSNSRTLFAGGSHGIVPCGKGARNRNCGRASVGQRGCWPAPTVGHAGTVPAWDRAGNENERARPVPE